MIKITLDYRDDVIESFNVEGHAGSGPYGQDIYCAGVSAITQTALLGLAKHISLQMDYVIREGYISCKLPAALSDAEREKAQVILSTMEAGLLAMQEAYSDYLRVVIRRP
ncbi:ribosomal-processing cysteine protease Prp [Syntrophomonas palmitatica]|uniref:ribosomal-processing cysteine protease Prp n=1 Tax=Syntrophomonas palmitatica TaxID=402877 RepID=UPI0006D2368F|nr:ribosomal-processing cysteine protease Prp [Syntrophomonas palmitatica]